MGSAEGRADNPVPYMSIVVYSLVQSEERRGLFQDGDEETIVQLYC